MNKLLVIVGSVRPGRIGLPIAQWLAGVAAESGEWEVDLADLAEIALPFMDEPKHPRLRQYEHEHTLAWSARVDAADAIVLVMPEYNHSFAPALKNALDYLAQEWWRKPVAFASYGGASAGTRAAVALEPAVIGLGMVKTGANLEIPFASALVTDGAFHPTEREVAVAGSLLAELAQLAPALRPLQNR